MASLDTIKPQLMHWLEVAKGFTGPEKLFVGLVLVFVFLYSMSVGKTRALIALLALYAAYVITALFPFWDQLFRRVTIQAPGYYIKMAVFVLIYAGVFAILNRSYIRSRLSLSELSLGHVLVVSIAQVGLLASMLVSFMPLQAIPDSFKTIYPYLGGSRALFFWAIGALLVVPLMQSAADAG